MYRFGKAGGGDNIMLSCLPSTFPAGRKKIITNQFQKFHIFKNVLPCPGSRVLQGAGGRSVEKSPWQRLGLNCWPWICWRCELLWETHAMECDVACSSRRGLPGTRAGIVCHQPGPSPAPLNFWCQHNLKTSTWKENKALNTSYGSSAVVMVRYKNVKI